MEIDIDIYTQNRERPIYVARITGAKSAQSTKNATTSQPTRTVTQTYRHRL